MKTHSILGVAAILVLQVVLARAESPHGTSSSNPPRRAAAPAARIGAASARAIARARVHGGRIKSEELEKEGGRWIYSYDFVVPGRAGVDEVNVDAKTGTIVAVHHENPRAEHRERALESHQPKSGSTSH